MDKSEFLEKMAAANNTDISIIAELLKERTVKIDLNFEKNEHVKRLAAKAMKEKDIVFFDNFLESVTITGGKVTNSAWVLFLAYCFGVMYADEKTRESEGQ